MLLLLLYTWYLVPGIWHLVRFTLGSYAAVQQAERGADEKAPHGGHRGEDFQQVLLSFLAEITRTVRVGASLTHMVTGTWYQERPLQGKKSSIAKKEIDQTRFFSV